MTTAELERLVDGITSSEKFGRLPDEEKQNALRELRDSFVHTNPGAEEEANFILQNANQNYLRAVGEGRFQPDINSFDRSELPFAQEDFSLLSEEEKLNQIEEFREVTAPKLAAKDPINEEDTEFFLRQVANHEQRKVIGQDTNPLTDKAFRFAEGFAAGVAESINATETAEAIRNYIPDNPDYDDNFASKLATGFGDFGSSMAIFIAGTSASGNPAVGLGASLTANSVRRFNEGQKQALELGLSEKEQAKAGLAAMPGAAVDVLGDRLLVGRFAKVLPKGVRNQLSRASNRNTKKEIIAGAFEDTQLRKKLFRAMNDGLKEGSTEVAGDVTASLGAYAATGSRFDEFLPSKGEMFDSFMIGAVIGVTIGGVSEAPGLGFNTEVEKTETGTRKTRTLVDTNRQRVEETVAEIENPSVSVYDQADRESKMLAALKAGRFKEASQIALNIPKQNESGQLFPSALTESSEPEDPRLAQLQRDQERRDQEAVEREEININLETPFLPFEAGDTAAIAVENLKNPSEEGSQVLNDQAPDRARVQEEVKGLSQEGRNISEEESNSFFRFVDLIGTKFASENRSAGLNDFYSRLRFRSEEDLRPFNFIREKFTSSVQDPQRDRRLGRAASFQAGGQTNIGVSRRADVAALTHNFVGSLRQSGVLQDIIGQDGMDVVQRSLSISEFNFEADQKIGDALMDFLERGESEFTPEVENVLSGIRGWIKDLFQGLKSIFGPMIADPELDEQFSRLFDVQESFKPIEETLGRETEGQPVQPFRGRNAQGEAASVISDLQRSRVRTDQALGRTEPVVNQERTEAPRRSRQSPARKSTEEQPEPQANATPANADLRRRNQEEIERRKANFNRKAKNKNQENRTLDAIQNPVRDAEEMFEPSAFNGLGGFRNISIKVTVPIDTFLSAVEGLPPVRNLDLRERMMSGELIREAPILDLDVARNGIVQVMGHEGRNRMMILREMGYTHAPIQVRSQNIRWDQQLDPDAFSYVEDWPRVLVTENNQSIPFPLTRAGEFIDNINVYPSSNDSMFALTERAIEVRENTIHFHGHPAIDGIEVSNGRELFRVLESREPQDYLVRLISDNSKIIDGLSQVAVVNGSNNFYSPAYKFVSLNKTDDLQLISHELTHAVTALALANDPDFNQEIADIRADVQLSFNIGDSFREENILMRQLQFQYLDYRNSEEVNLRLAGRPVRIMGMGNFASRNLNDIAKEAFGVSRLNKDHARVIKNVYGLVDQDEFLAAFMSDIEFRKFLQSASNNTNFFQRVIDAIMRMLGVNRPGVDRNFNREAHEAIKKAIESDSTRFSFDDPGLSPDSESNLVDNAGLSLDEFLEKSAKLDKGRPNIFFANTVDKKEIEKSINEDGAFFVNINQTEKPTERIIVKGTSLDYKIDEHARSINKIVSDSTDLNQFKTFKDSGIDYVKNWNGFGLSENDILIFNPDAVVNPKDLGEININFPDSLPSLSDNKFVGDRIPVPSNTLEMYFNLPSYTYQENGQVKMGKLVSNKRGEAPISALKSLQGYDGRQMTKAEIELYKVMAPNAFTDTTVNLKALISELTNFNSLGEAEHFGGSTEFQTISYKSKADMEGYVEMGVSLNNIEGRSGADPVFNEHFGLHNLISHFRGFIQNIEGQKVFNIIEMQSDLEGDIDMQIKDIQDSIDRVENNQIEPDDVALSEDFGGSLDGLSEYRKEFIGRLENVKTIIAPWESMMLKRAIQHAKAQGATAIFIPDGPSASIAQGHAIRDDEELNRRRTRGMFSFYNEKLPKIAKKITKSKGVNVNAGPVTGKTSRVIDPNNPDGEFKSDVTGRMFDITQVNPAMETLFNVQTKEQNQVNKRRNKNLLGNVVNNGRELADWLTTYHYHLPISDHIRKNPRLLEFLHDVKVEQGPNRYTVESNTISLEGDSEVNAAHEITHALLFNALRRDARFSREIKDLMSATIDPNINRTAQRYKSILIEAGDIHRLNEDPRSLADFIAAEAYNIQRTINRGRSAENKISITDIRNAYAFTNADEFIAAAMSDPEFRQVLENSMVQGESLWMKLIKAIKNFLGIEGDSNNILDQVDQMVTQAIENDIVFRSLDTDVLPRNSKRVFNALQESEDSGHTKRDPATMMKWFNRIKNGKINDDGDTNTQLIIQALNRINPKDVAKLDEDSINTFYDYIENIYRARARTVRQPEARIDSADVLDTISSLAELLNQIRVSEILEAYDGLIDFNLFEGDITNPSELESFVNEMTGETGSVTQSIERLNSDKASRKTEAWRAKYEEIKEEININFGHADDWVDEFETFNGQKILDIELRDLIATHFDYLVNQVDINDLDGRELFDHFHAINNLLDGRVAHLPSTTVKHIARLRNSELDFETLRGKFRDPMVARNRFLENVDKIARSTELMQTQLARWSAFVEGKNALQEDIMGDLLDSIVRRSENTRVQFQEEYVEARTQVEQDLGRKINSQDRRVMAMVGRLIQFGVTENPDAAFLRNISNERKSFENVEKRVGNKGTRDFYSQTIVPEFNKLVEGIEDSDTPFQDFIDNIDARSGFGNSTEGAARVQLLRKMSEIMNRFTLDSEVVSEGFYGKPFDHQVNYLPKVTIPTNAEKANNKNADVELTAEVDELEGRPFRTSSNTAMPGHLESRKRTIGEKRYYSNNAENIFDRGLRSSSLTSATTAERFILKERLKKGSDLYQIITGKDGSDSRVNDLEFWAVDLMSKAMFSGEPLQSIGVIMKTMNEAFGRVALSGLHQGVTQAMSGFVDYQARTGNIRGAMEAASFYASNKSKVEQFFKDHARWITNRSLLGESELEQIRNPLVDENSLRSNPVFQQLQGMFDGAGKIITTSIRLGDGFAAQSLVMAEYVRLLGLKNSNITSIEDIDFDVVDERALTQAIVNVEKNINSSNKILRGELFSDRNSTYAAFRNILFAFSSHVMTLSAQLNLAVRDIVDLRAAGASDEQITPNLQIIGAILGQTFAFSTGRYLINATIGVAIFKLLQEMFDDEEGKIAELELAVSNARENGDPVLIQRAEDDLRAAELVSSSLDRFKNRTFSMDSFFKGAVRDQLSVTHFVFNGPEIPQKMIFKVPDKLIREMMNEEIESKAEVMRGRIRDLKDQKEYGKAARVSEQLETLENASYIPFDYQEFGGFGIGGITGASLNAIHDNFQEASYGAMGFKEWNYNDAILAAQSAGLGQADLLRYFREVDKIEDKLFELNKDSDERMAEAAAAKTEKMKKEQEKRRKAILRKLR